MVYTGHDAIEKIKPENYPNKRRYNAARTLANESIVHCSLEYEKQEKACCQFIIDNADTIFAANYLSYRAGFLYAQAIKDHFQLPISLPDEDETREMEFSQIVRKIAKRDIPLSLRVWRWCLRKFMPYAQYDRRTVWDMTTAVLNELPSFPEGYRLELIRCMGKNTNFTKTVLEAECEASNGVPELIATAIKAGNAAAAQTIFGSALAKASADWKQVNALAEGIIYRSKNYEEVETIEYFRDTMLPQIKAIHIGMVQDEVAGWEADIAEYIAKVVAENDKYAYARENAWRLSVPSGEKYGLDPRNYKTEQTYLAAVEKEKYGWRARYKNMDTLGLDVNCFETREEYQAAYDALVQEKQKKVRLRQERSLQEALADKTVYTICGVVFTRGTRPYYYLAEGMSFKVGDIVMVPAGETKKEGTVVSVGQYLRVAAPFPVEKMKKIQ